MKKAIVLAGGLGVALFGFGAETATSVTSETASDAFHSWATRKHEGIPAIAASPKSGRLWATWYGGPTDSEDSNNYVILATSSDGGTSWKPRPTCGRARLCR